MSKMLIVDDEEKIRAVVREYAEFEEFEVTEARDGMEAVALCRENDYDIIIMDVMMPRLDGYSACKEIRMFPLSCCPPAARNTTSCSVLKPALTTMW